MKLLLPFLTSLAGLFSSLSPVALTVQTSMTVPALGACQGASYQQGRLYLYGDREVGVIRAYAAGPDSLRYTGQEIKLTVGGQDVINHPTGLAWHGQGPTFLGNSIRLNPEGTQWRAVIYCLDWAGLLRTGTLDGNLRQTIEDDAAIQGSRPEYVQYRGKWYVATADYGNHGNEVRLYDPARLAQAHRTSEPGVLAGKFTCSPWVQNMLWVPARGTLVLIQNQVEGRRWRFTFVDLAQSMAAGHEVVRQVVDVDKTDELEGFTLLGDEARGLAVTSSRTANAHFVRLAW
ncbi:hypothetical protein HHL22_03925 [Hymenobacter sp. RP-2-7]|uniref:Esterase-like activity of phytase family protein n=1 Tax=Hymenobacter polaris TaxID=2682546 RepID=A0A7Y0ABI5_9BACT|nr:hypothetical protein [Hymenobacter polaris]NML64346.1 hypothetical protein [Hymenobacter polaris]